MRTFSPAPCTAASAASAPTPASLTEAGLPSRAIASSRSKQAAAAFIVCKGTCVA